MIVVETRRRSEIVDITDEVRRKVRESGVNSGIALIYTPHTTSGLIINEAESGLIEDIVEALDEIVPKISFRHNRIDDNADAHIKASIVGNSVIVPVENSDLVLGTWQRILFIEFDGPRRRKVYVRVYEG
ncbi:secondary thiamine-phosphate synthase enzyme YjbQ [Ferroglobus sp.]|uniref:secondary thiamine-phosphate synthase enzyme YjbQ n=1 Tax=Ferroglobus sp. TaxID=2614230 RepID=UPI0025BC34DF|nr:secondary thiamine-phosphate synthase enzyme YjbQ [Ferroglobus sp.]